MPENYQKWGYFRNFWSPAELIFAPFSVLGKNSSYGQNIHHCFHSASDPTMELPEEVKPTVFSAITTGILSACPMFDISFKTQQGHCEISLLLNIIIGTNVGHIIGLVVLSYSFTPFLIS